MAVTADELSSLDLTIWLKSQSKASSFLKSSQPVISRNIQKVFDVFDINYYRSNGEYRIEPDAALRRLNIERCLHQELRFHDPNAVLRFDAFPKVKTNLTTKVICHPWQTADSLIQSPILFRKFMDLSIIDAYMDFIPEAANIQDRYASIPISRYSAFFGAAKGHPLTKKKDEISLSDAIDFPFYFGSPDDLPLTYKAMADKGITLYKGARMTRLKYILSLFSNQNYLFPIMPGAKTAFEENLIDLCIKIPIEFENRLIIKKEFTNSPKLKILLSGIKSTHERCKDIYPGWIASLL